MDVPDTTTQTAVTQLAGVAALFDPEAVIAYLWVLLLSGWAGVVSYIRKLHDGLVERFSLSGLVGEIVIASFAGLITYWLCVLGNLPGELSAILIAVSGHMGARAIHVTEMFVEAWISRMLKRFGVNQPELPKRD